jgi:nicotinamide-nucleotide amidase
VTGGSGASATDAAAAVIALAADAGLRVATAESLTAGAVVARLVDVPGASACVSGGAACYSYEAKQRVLGVDGAELSRTGAVTASVARQMARGALDLYDADLAVSTTGVAGPGPDERGMPAGTVHLALAVRAGARGEGADPSGADPAGAGTGARIALERELHLPGSRGEVRAACAAVAVDLLRTQLERMAQAPF